MDGYGYGYGPGAIERHQHMSGHLLFILLIVVGVAALAHAAGWLMARRDENERRVLARKAIYLDVRRAINKALEAEGADLVNAAQHLIDKVRSRIGAASALNRAVAGPSEAITKAISARIIDPPKPPPPPPPPVPMMDPPPTIIVNPPSMVTRVNVFEAELKTKKPPEKPPEPEKPKERDMTLKEQLTALRLAVESFSAAWEAGAVDKLLEDLQTAVLEARLPKEPTGR